MCTGCGSRTSVLAGTIFDRTRTPLTAWFSACWLFATGKDGISALSLKQTLEIGSQQTVWTILHRFRYVLVRPDRERLCRTVEVDETYIGGQEFGLSGGRARGKKTLTRIAIEVVEPKGSCLRASAGVAVSWRSSFPSGTDESTAKEQQLHRFPIGNLVGNAPRQQGARFSLQSGTTAPSV